MLDLLEIFLKYTHTHICAHMHTHTHKQTPKRFFTFTKISQFLFHIFTVIFLKSFENQYIYDFQTNSMC